MLESVWLKYKLGPCALCLWVALPRPCVCVCLKVMFSHRLNVKRKALTKCVCSSSRMCDPDPHHSPLCVCPYVQMIDDPSSSRVRSRYATFPVQIFCVCVCEFQHTAGQSRRVVRVSLHVSHPGSHEGSLPAPPTWYYQHTHLHI